MWPLAGLGLLAWSGGTSVHAAAPTATDEPPAAVSAAEVEPEDASEDTAAAVRAPDVFVVVQPDTDPGLIEALDTAQAQLSGQGLSLARVERRADQTAAATARALLAEHSARGAFWLDIQPAEIRVFLLASDGAAYVRRVPVDAEGAEAGREAVWLIVESGSLALASGAEVAMEAAPVEDLEPAPPEAEPQAPPRPAPTPTVEPVVEPAPRHSSPRDAIPPGRRGVPPIQIGVDYIGEGLASTVPWQSGLGVDALLLPRPLWRVGVRYGLMIPWRGDDPPVTWRHSVQLRAGPALIVGRLLEVSLLAGGGVEALRWRNRTTGARGWRAMGTAGLDAGLQIFVVPGRLVLSIEPGAAVVFNRFAFVECEAAAPACQGDARAVVLDPWRVRPRLRAGLATFF